MVLEEKELLEVRAGRRAVKRDRTRHVEDGLCLPAIETRVSGILETTMTTIVSKRYLINKTATSNVRFRLSCWMGNEWVREKMGLLAGWLGYCGGSATSKLIVPSCVSSLERPTRQSSSLSGYLRNSALLAQDASVISASKDGVSIPRAGPLNGAGGQTPHFPRFLSGFNGLQRPIIGSSRSTCAAEGFHGCSRLVLPLWRGRRGERSRRRSKLERG